MNKASKLGRSKTNRMSGPRELTTGYFALAFGMRSGARRACLGFDFGWERTLRCAAMPRFQRKFRLPHPEPTDALTYARFTGIPTFLRLPYIDDPEELEVALVGVPFDGGTTYRSGPRFGPRHVREQSAIIRPWNP